MTEAKQILIGKLRDEIAMIIMLAIFITFDRVFFMLAVGSQQILNLWCCFHLHIPRRLSADTLSLPPTK